MLVVASFNKEVVVVVQPSLIRRCGLFRFRIHYEYTNPLSVCRAPWTTDQPMMIL
jgi:hypothetical protein